MPRHAVRRPDDLPDQVAGDRQYLRTRRSSFQAARASPSRSCRAAARRHCRPRGDFPMLTEHRAGTYIYNDVMMVDRRRRRLGRLRDAGADDRGQPADRQPARSSTPASKVLTYDQYYAQGLRPHHRISRRGVPGLSEEHGMVDLSACKREPDGRRGRPCDAEPLLRRSPT